MANAADVDGLFPIFRLRSAIMLRQELVGKNQLIECDA
jgi:hypothetical protein